MEDLVEAVFVAEEVDVAESEGGGGGREAGEDGLERAVAGRVGEREGAQADVRVEGGEQTWARDLSGVYPADGVQLDALEPGPGAGKPAGRGWRAEVSRLRS